MKVKYEISNSLKKVWEEIKDKPIEIVLQRIADLEAKLAVYEKELMDNEKCFTEKDVESLIKDREETIKFLKQQLAENGTDKNNEECFKAWVINDLTDKLKKSEEEKETLRISQSSTHKTMMQLNDELLKTQKKLAEKEKQLSEYSDINNALNNGLADKCISCEEEYNQDKISFAVQQLEKVKEWVIGYSDLRGQNWEHTLRFLKNQIASLKKEVE